MSTSSAALPGFGGPAVGFDTPFEMLKACHERVLRSLALQARLIEHLGTHGCDASARSAAQDVLRYFDVAAPLHHEDEELHVFPALAEHGDAALAKAVAQLSAEHGAMADRWSAAREVLQAIAVGAEPAPEGPAPLPEHQRAVLEAFAEGYADHIALEEGLVYPAAMACMSPAALAAMGQDMRRRRGAAV